MSGWGSLSHIGGLATVERGPDGKMAFYINGFQVDHTTWFEHLRSRRKRLEQENAERREQLGRLSHAAARARAEKPRRVPAAQTRRVRR